MVMAEAGMSALSSTPTQLTTHAPAVSASGSTPARKPSEKSAGSSPHSSVWMHTATIADTPCPYSTFIGLDSGAPGAAKSSVESAPAEPTNSLGWYILAQARWNMRGVNRFERCKSVSMS